MGALLFLSQGTGAHLGKPGMAGDFCAALLLLTPLLTAIWFLTTPGGSGPPLLRGRDTVLLAPAPSPGRRAVRTPVAAFEPMDMTPGAL